MLYDRLGTALAWLFFQSNAIKKVYFTTVSSPNPAVRLLGFTFIALVFVGRVSRSFWVLSWATVALGGAATVCFAALGYWAALVLPAAGIAWVAWRVAQQPGDGVGHRAGWKGYQGKANLPLLSMNAVLQSPLEVQAAYCSQQHIASCR